MKSKNFYVILFLIFFSAISFGFAKDVHCSKQTPNKEDYNITGFRSASFGMKKSDVVKAIKKDFAKVEIEENIHETDKTEILTIIVSDLLPDIAKARINYIFGYESKKLIQVNILVATRFEEISREDVQAAGRQLFKYFTSTFAVTQIKALNAKLDDGTTLLLRAEDPKKSIVLMQTNVYIPENVAIPENAEFWLMVSYVKDPDEPDIFRIKKGQF